MPKNEVEIVKYPKIKHIKMFVNRMSFKEAHIHNDFEIAFLLSGECYIGVNGQEHILKEGDIFFVNSGDIHNYYISYDAKDLTINKKNKDIKDPQLPLFLFVQISNHFLVREYFPEIRTTIFNSCSLKEALGEEEFKKISLLLLDAACNYFEDSKPYVLDIISDISKCMSICYKKLPYEIINEGQKQKLVRKNARLERIISYIEENFDTQIRLEDLAKMEGLSVTHFSHLFSSSFNLTFQEYVSIKRLEQCIRLMNNKEKTLLEISYESGFSDPKYMNKIFINKFGCTPKEYRKNLLNNSNHMIDFKEGSQTLEFIYNDSNSIKVVKEYYTKYLGIIKKTF